MKNTSKFLSKFLIAATILLLTACGGGGGSSSPTTYTVGGNLEGLTSGTLTIVLNKTETLNLTQDGNFTFPAINAGSAYAVTIVTQPNGETCGFTHNPSGANLSANINNIVISCSQTTYTVGGTVTGLQPGQLLNLVDKTPYSLNEAMITQNGNFTMFMPYVTGEKYHIGLSSFNYGVQCTIANGSGRVTNANITNIQIVCSPTPPPVTYSISGTITAPGVTFDGKAGIILNTNSSFNSAVQFTPGKSTFSFQNIAPNSDYILTIKNYSNNYVCSVNNNIGTNITGNISNVAVVCSTNGYSLSVNTSNANLSSSDNLIIEDENYYYGQVSATYKPGEIPAVATLANVNNASTSVIANNGSYQVAAFAYSLVDGIVSNPRLCTFNGNPYITGTNINANVNITNMDCSTSNP